MPNVVTDTIKNNHFLKHFNNFNITAKEQIILKFYKAKERCNIAVSGMTNVVTDTVKNNQFLKCFKNFSITAIEQDIYKFVAINDESIHVFQKRY